MSCNQQLDHLTDGRPVVVPYLSLAHYERDDPRASPTVETVHAAGDAHPYNGRPVALVRVADGALRAVNVDLLLHARATACPRCAPTWRQLDERIADLPSPDASFLGCQAVPTVEGDALLVIDVEDLEGVLAPAAREDTNGDGDPSRSPR